MLSTLKYIFQGRRDLFQGLAIDKMDYDWKTYPVISFDFFPVETASFDVFKEDLRTNVKRALAEAGADWDESVSTHLNFAAAIDQLAAASEHGQVVVLIDEYDAPVGHALLDTQKATAIREQLSYIYAQLKSHVPKIRFLMMTGVTRFTQLSVFSALNNLNDLTMDSRYATLLGYTEEELAWASLTRTTERNSAGGTMVTGSPEAMRCGSTTPLPLPRLSVRRSRPLCPRGRKPAVPLR